MMAGTAPRSATTGLMARRDAAGLPRAAAAAVAAEVVSLPDEAAGGVDRGTATGSPALPVSRPRFQPTVGTRLQGRLSRRLAMLISRWVLGVRLQPTGGELVPADEPLIVAVGPHRSWLDAFLVMMALPPCPRAYFFGSAEALLGTWWKRAILRLFGGIVPVSTLGQLNREALETSLAILAAGNRLVIFPEGWGVLDGPPATIGTVKRGVSFLSQHSGCRVLPVGLAGTGKLWRGKRLPLRFGAPLPALASDANRAAAAAFATRLHTALTAMLPDLPSPPESPAPAGERVWMGLRRLLR